MNPGPNQRPRPARRIQTRILIFAAVLTFGTVGFFLGLAAVSLEAQESSAARSHFGEVFRSFAKLAGESLGRDALLEEFSRYSKDSPGGLAVEYALFDKDGFLISSSGGAGLGVLPSRRVGSALLMSSSDGAGFQINVSGDRFGRLFRAQGPVRDARGGAYGLMLQARTKSNLSVPRTLFKVTFLFLPLVLLAAVGAGWLLAVQVLKPIRRLSEAARKLSLETGKLPDLPVSGSGDELDELARTFNLSFHRVSEAYQKTLQFAADASHELRLPLTAIRVEAEVALKRARNAEDYREILGSILEELGRLETLLNRLLGLTRSESGVNFLEKKTLSLKNCLQRLCEFYGPLAEEKQIRLSCSCQTEGVFEGDPARLEELLANLLDNAVKYAPAGGRVEAELAEIQDGFEIRIRDNGPGIAPEDQHRIFDRFVRLDPSRTRDSGPKAGFGLGLPIARSIAEAHGGRIRCESELGRGACFIVFIPHSTPHRLQG